MRIFKAHNYYLQPGGEDTVFESESSLLRSHGHEVIEYIEHNKKIEFMNPASVALQTIWSHPSYKRIRHALEETQPDVAHFHNIFPLLSPSVYYACQDLGIPIVQTLDNQRLLCPSANFYRDGKLCLDCLGKTPPWPGVVHACYHHSHVHTAVVASMLSFHRWLGTWKTKVDLFLCSTDFYRNLFIQAGLPASKITVLPHFVSENSQSKSKTRRAGEYALFLGRLDPEKGVNTLLEAWRHLNFPLRIRGSGRLEGEARMFAKQHALENIRFVERMSKEELSDLIENAKFLVMPSEGYYETFGMVIIEAYARGVPVIASNIGVVPELVADKRTGLLFEAGNALDLANKAMWLWNSADERARMGHNALKEYEEKYVPERNYRMLMDIYSRVIATKENK